MMTAFGVGRTEVQPGAAAAGRSEGDAVVDEGSGAEAGGPAEGAEQGPEGHSARAVSAAAEAAAAAAAGGTEGMRFAMGGRIFGKRRTIFAAVPIAAVLTNPKQPRQYFDDKALNDLADSIRKRGVLQPVIVRREEDGTYTLIAGERRLRASKLAGVEHIPAIMSEDDLLEVALEENVQREDLSPLEEAEALSLLASERDLSHGDLAKVIHKSRPYVSNTLALTRLPTEIKQEYFAMAAPISREIMISIARQESEEAMHALWKRVKLDAMSVRSFRNEQRAKEPEAASRPAIRAVRRLGRALKDIDSPAAMAPEEALKLRRSLVRLRGRIERLLGELPTEVPAEPAPQPAAGEPRPTGEALVATAGER